MPEQTGKPAKKHTLLNCIIILIILAILALTAGFFVYVRNVRLYPNMPGVIGAINGIDHFSSDDFCGIYDYGQTEQEPVRSEESKPILSKSEGSYNVNTQNVSAISVEFPKYTLFANQQPATVTLYYDKDEKLVGTRISYLYTADEMLDFNDDLAKLEYETDRIFAPNALFRMYDNLANKLHIKQHNVYRTGPADATELVIEELYRSHAYA